ncbi:MAG: type II toxin-antitoxin system HicA family toxin [Candidatus Hydrogenedentota bacterium]
MVAALKKAGFEEQNQTGSHLALHNPSTGRMTVVAIHTRDIKRGLMKKILKQAGLSEDEFRELL